MRLVTPSTTSGGQSIKLLRTFKNESAEKYGILSSVLPNSLHEAEVQGPGAPYLVEFFELVFSERHLAGPAVAFYLAGVGSENLSHPDNLAGADLCLELDCIRLASQLCRVLQDFFAFCKLLPQVCTGLSIGFPARRLALYSFRRRA